MESQFRDDDLIPPLPIASPPTYILLIDSRVSNYQDIINAKQPSVHHIVFDAPSRPTHSTKLIKNIEDQIAALGLSAITSIGLVQHNDGLPFYEMLGPLSDVVKPQIHAVETHDPDFQTWNSISIFITKLRRNYGIVNFDMMACALYSNPDWKYIIDRLTALTGVTVRASTDDTGAASLGGDWFLESHTGVNLKSVYFTDAIESYNGILVSTTGDSSGVPWSSTAKKLILIDHTIPDIHVMINAMNDDTYALVFNTQYDTEDTILSKLRFLSGTNRYILDSFYYGDTAETAVLTPAQLRTETNWQFYPDSTPTTKVIQPVFFQRAIPNATTSEPDVPDISSYVPRDRIRITDLDEIYEIAKAAGEANDEIEFECIGIIQHAPLTTLGYKLTNIGSYATIENVSSVDPNLSSWSHFGAFLERLKSVYHMTTLDLMACALYANPDWKYIIDHLAAQHAITIRASLDNTGNTNDGGNWILETAEINLTTVYFTNAIHEWAHLLPTSLTTLRFDGVDDAVNLGVPAWSYSTQFRSTMTIECWFKTTDTNNQKLGNFVSRWISGGYASHSMFLIGMNPTGEITCWITNASGGFASTQTSAAYKDTLWHHVAVTYNSSTGVLSMYIDGVFTNNSTNSAYPTTSSFGLLSNNTTTRVIFGSDDAGTSPNTQTDRQFRGSLSDIRIWNVVRSGAEIAANYRRRLIGNETGLVGYWKLHQGNGTGWGSYSVAMDSTTNRTNGTLVGMGATPSGSWVTTTDLSFNPRISTMTLGANNGVYNTSDVSFSFIDPSSNSLGSFSYAVTPSSVATIANGAATTKTIYATSGAISIPTLSLFEFPEIASLSSWQIDISFTMTGGAGTWRGLIGDMYNSMNSRGWGLWVSSSNRISWSWMATTSEPATISVNLNTAYVLTASQSSGTITLTLRTVSTGATQTGSFSNGANVIGKGPVTIGGWQNTTGENFIGTISYVNVSVPTNQRVVTLSSGTTGTPATVTATQDSSLDFSVGTQTAALTVNSSSPTFSTSFANVTKNFLDSSFALVSPVSNSIGAFSFSSSNTAVATINSATTINALQFNGTTNFIDFVSNITELGKASFTIECWVKTSGTSMGLLNCQDSDTAWEPGEKSLYIDGNGMPAFVGWGNNWIYSTSAVNDNAWHHIAVAWAYTSGTSGTGSIYIDGMNRTSTNYSIYGAYTADYNNFGTFVFGKPNNTESVNFFNGAVCELRIWNVARSATDIFQNYRRMLVGNESGLVAYNRFNQGTAGGTNTGITTVTNNKTSGGNTGTLNGSFALTGTASNWVSGVSIRPTNDVNVVGGGSATITATQEATSGYTSQTTTATLTVNPIAPTIGALTAPAKNFGDAAFNLTAPTSNSDGAFTYTSSNTTVVTVTSGGTVTIVGAGTTTITATQAATTNYTSGSVTASLVVSAALSNFTVPSDKVYGDSTFDLTNPTTIYTSEPFLFTSSDITVASIGGAGGRTVTILKAGSTTITARQAATGAHSELTINAILVIAKKTPVITLAAITKIYGDTSFNISPSSSNTDAGAGAGAFTFTSRNSNILSIFDASNAAITGVGTTTLDISQSETTNFTSGSAVVAVTVSKGTPVLSPFTVSTGRTYGTAPFSAIAYPSSSVVDGGVIIYSSTDSTVATIDSTTGIITLIKAGYVNFIATQQATAFYNSVTKSSNTMTVYRQILPLTRSSPTSSTINKTYGDGYFNVIATNASNGGTITYETNNPGVAGIVGSATAGVISVVSVGSATITARREDTDQYTSDPVSWTVEVARATTTLTGLTDLSYNVTTAPFTVAASSLSDGAVTYSLQNPSSSVLTIHPTTGLVTLRSAGSAVIVASQAQGTLYLAPADITATITVTSAGNALQGATITSTTSFADVNLEGASLAGVSITNTAFTAANLTNANLTNAVIVSANFASADLSGATLAGATITGATFTSASLKNADLSGAVLTNTVFTGSDLSGARLTGVDASGASFANARLTNVDMTGANIENVNFTNTSIKGANIADVSFSPLQKLQLLKNSDNRDIGQIIIPAVTGSTVLAAISESSPLRAIENLDLATATVAVVVPTTSTSPTAVLPDVVLNVSDNDKFYLPINESEFFQIEGVKYFATGGIVRNYLTNAVVEVINYNGTPVWLLAGSIVGLVLQTNTLNSTPFVVPSRMLLTTAEPFMPTTIPTSNNTSTPIVYSSDNTNVATINPSSGQITITGNATGFVRFTATQVQNATYEPGVSVSNTLFVDRSVIFTLAGLNQTIDLSTLAMLDVSSISMDSTDATAVLYVRLSDINNVFMYQSDANDITNVTADDIKYYVFHRKWPTELKVNPSHAMLDKPESAGMLGHGEGYTADKSLIKHDFIRYISLRLFNTIHGVDLFHNEAELLENTTFLGETVRNNIDTILSGVSTTSASGTMSYDASGNKYLTNDASGNTNLSREIMRHIASVAPSRFYGNVPDHAGLKNVPFMENDTLQYKLVVQAAATQNLLTGVSVIPSRSYTIKLVLKNTVNASTNANAVVTDSEMYPNAYPYPSSVVTYAPTTDSSNVYTIYSPPAPIPFARFGYNGWYYTNSTTWVNVAPAVRNHVKWLVSANTATSKVSDLQYIRVHLKIHNTAALPYVMIYTQAGSSRKYVVVSGNGSLVNGTVYSLYINFNTYTREPATIGATNAALAYTVGTGSFANNETITSIAIETDSNATAGNVEFTLSSVIVGELNGEKEYGFEAAVPQSYP